MREVKGFIRDRNNKIVRNLLGISPGAEAFIYRPNMHPKRQSKVFFIPRCHSAFIRKEPLYFLPVLLLPAYTQTPAVTSY